jgi:hypothetical protein
MLGYLIVPSNALLDVGVQGVRHGIGLSGFADWSLCPRHVLRAPRAGAAGALPVAEVSRLDQPEIRLDGRR